MIDGLRAAICWNIRTHNPSSFQTRIHDPPYFKQDWRDWLQLMQLEDS